MDPTPSTAPVPPSPADRQSIANNFLDNYKTILGEIKRILTGNGSEFERNKTFNYTTDVVVRRPLFLIVLTCSIPLIYLS